MLIIFSGFNQRAVIALLRSLRINHIEEYVILACEENDPIFKTAYARKVYYVRKHRELNKVEIYDIFRRIVSENTGSKAVVVPTTEGLNRFLIEFRDEVEAIGITVPLVGADLYKKISDKHAFWELCKKNNLQVPRIFDIRNEFCSKYVAKPKSYLTSSGEKLDPIIVDNKKTHKAFLQNYKLSDFDTYEFIDGESIYLLYYFAKTGENYSFSQRNLAQQPNGKSIIAAIAWDTHKEAISNEYIGLFRRFDFFGFIMIELRKRDNSYYMIEANPRMWGPSQLYVDADIPFIEAFLYDYGIIDRVPDRSGNAGVTYFWSGGLKENLLEDKACVWLEQGREIVNLNADLFFGSDIYKREDTLNIFADEQEAWEISDGQ